MNKVIKNVFTISLVAFAFIVLLSIITPKVSATEINLVSSNVTYSMDDSFSIGDYVVTIDKVNNTGNNKSVLLNLYSKNNVLIESKTYNKNELIFKDKLSSNLTVNSISNMGAKFTSLKAIPFSNSSSGLANSLFVNKNIIYINSLNKYNEEVIDYVNSTKDLIENRYINEINKRIVDLTIPINKLTVNLNNPYKFNWITSFNSNFFETEKEVKKYLVIAPKDSDVVEDQYQVFLSSTTHSADPYFTNHYFLEGTDFSEIMKNSYDKPIQDNITYEVYGKSIISNLDGKILEIIKTNKYEVIFNSEINVDIKKVAISNLTNKTCQNNEGQFKIEWASNLPNWNHTLHIYDSFGKEQVLYVNNDKDVVGLENNSLIYGQNNVLVRVPNIICGDSYILNIEAKKGNEELDSIKYKFDFENTTKTNLDLKDWYSASYAHIQFSKDTPRDNDDVISFKESPIYLDLTYETELPYDIFELQSIVVVISEDGSDNAVFYPTLKKDGVKCVENTIGDSGVKTRFCEFDYTVPIYKAFKKGMTYRFNYLVYPATNKEFVSQEEYNSAIDNLQKIKFREETFSKTPYNGSVDLYSQSINRFLWNNKGLSPIANQKGNLVVKVVDQDSSNNNVGLDQTDPTVTKIVTGDSLKISNALNKKNVKYSNSVVTAVDSSNIQVENSTNDSSADIYVKVNNDIKKLKDVRSILSSKNLSLAELSSDVSIVNIDDVPNYVFETKKQRKFLGIPFGYKTSYHVVEAVDKIED